ncbi:MAG: glycosyltransferase [Peptococcaceae bacterium]|nr:glycosyltransferase [Peptococcaceae bacterium]
MPKVSVILTSFNHAKYLCKAIDSVLNQTYGDFELIIWDDASADESWFIINGYKDSRIKAFRNKERKRGVYGINKAIREIARGEYIAIHHSDDIWEPHKLEHQVKFMDEHLDIGAVFTNALAIGEDGAALEDTSHFYYSIFEQPNRSRHEWLNRFFYKGNALCHPSVLIRRQCYIDCGLYRPWLAQVADFDMWIRLCLKHNIYVFPEKLVRFRVRDNEANTSGNHQDARIRGMTEFHYILRNYLLINTFDEMVSIFPEAQNYFRVEGFENQFVLAMICLGDKSLHWAKFLGLELLYELLSDAEKAERIKNLYSFDYRNFIELTAIYDIFSLETVANLSQTIAEHDGQIASLTCAMAERDEQIANLNQAMAERDKQIANFSHAVAERDAKIASLSQAVAEQDGQITSLSHAVAERDGQIANLSQAVAGRDEQIANLNKAVAGRDVQIANLNQAVSERDGQIASLSQMIADRDRQINELEQIYKGQVQRLEEVLLSVYRSRSWRITAPLRKLMTIMRCIKSQPSNKAESSDLVIGVRNDAGQHRKSLTPVTVTHRSTFKILLVSYYCPTRAHAGGLRILDIYTLIKERHPYIQLDLYTHYRPNIDWSLDEIYKVFDNVYLSPNEDLSPEGFRALSNSNDIYNIVDLQFHQSGKHINGFRRLGNKIIFTPMESLIRVFYIDLQRVFKNDRDVGLKEIAKNLHSAIEEIKISLKSDETICVSRSDAAFLRFVTGSRKIRPLETGLSRLEFINVLSREMIEIAPEKKAMRIIYIAYFGSETNVIALHWYLDHVHPRVKAQVPEYMLSVIGRGDLTSFAGYDDASIEFIGEVPNIAPYIEQAKVGIAPALSGAGFRGKINQYAIFGVPSVVSTIASKGLAYKDNESIFIADSPELFSQRCIELLTDNLLNAKIGTKARSVCLDRYTWESKWKDICDIYNLEDLNE